MTRHRNSLQWGLFEGFVGTRDVSSSQLLNTQPLGFFEPQCPRKLVEESCIASLLGLLKNFIGAYTRRSALTI